MSLSYNAERGEVPLTVGGVDLVIAAGIGALAILSTRLGSQSFLELYSKLAGVELAATLAAIELLTVNGDPSAAIKEMSIADLPACKDAFVAALLHHSDKTKGNVLAAKEKAKAKSHGGAGSDSQS